MSYICVIKTKNSNDDKTISINDFNMAINYINDQINKFPPYYVIEALILEERSYIDGWDICKLVASISIVR